MQNVERMHPKLTHSIELMILNSKVNYPFYGEFLLQTNFYEKKNDPRIKTAAVNVSSKGMNFFYNPEFIDGLTQEQVNFLCIHELFHLLFNHVKRTRMGGYDHQLSNIAQDMIINTIIAQDIRPDFVDIPKDKMGHNSALFTPKEYDKEMVFEILYDWLKERKEDFDKKRAKKEDEKIFAELFVKPNRPTPGETKTGIHNISGMLNVFNDSLIESSKDESLKYMRNFCRRVIVNIEKGKEIQLIGHTSSVVPLGEAADYNQLLSERRAQTFKMAVMDQIEQYVDIYSLAMAILNNEKANMSQDDMLNFITQYEEITNKTIILQRKKDLIQVEAKTPDTIATTYETYRFTELNKLDEATLKSMVHASNLQVPNLAQEKLRYLQLAEDKLIPVGKGDTELLILNELDDNPSVLRKDVAHLPQYKALSNLKDSEEKQRINRRVIYVFPPENGQGMGGGESPESENQGNRSGYGKNGKNDQECFDLESIFEKAEENDGEFMDAHLGDDIPEELREQMVRDAVERLKARGLMTADLESILNKLQKKRKDYLKEIKRGVSQIKGYVKERTILKPSRRSILGLKGSRKYGAKLNVILDVSGSMGGYFEKALSFIFRSDIVVNLIQIDTEVKAIENIKSMKDLQKVQIRGGGGTTMKLAFDVVREKYNNLNTLLLTDGYTEHLDLGGMKGKVLIISVGQECPISVSNGKLKQICVDDND